MEFDMTHIAMNFNRDETAAGKGPVQVGWFLSEKKGTVVYYPPERLTSGAENKLNSKSASRCPAVLAMEARYFVVKCPFDLHLGFGRDEKGKAVLRNKAGQQSGIRSNKIGQVMHLTAEHEWRFPDRPTIQLKLPYNFIADETVYMTQISCFAHYRKNPLPGTIFGGRFPVNIWPRPLMWAFEWHDPSQDIILKRGEPLFYCQFETTDPARPIQVFEAEVTQELQDYCDHVSGAVNYVNQSFSLFKAAEEVRPEKLLVRKR